MRRDFYIYLHKTLDNQPFYIGRGCGYRARRKSGRSKDWFDKAKDGYTIEILKDNLTEVEAYESERLFISKFGRIDNQTGSLINKTDGGSGGTTGRIVSEEEKLRISNTLKEKYKSGSLKINGDKISKANKGKPSKKRGPNFKERVRVLGVGKGGNNPSKGGFKVSQQDLDAIKQIKDYKVACKTYNICPATYYKIIKKN